MPLYIRDDKVDDLAEQVMRATGAKSKTDAVRRALWAQLEAISAATPLSDKVKAAQSIAADLPPLKQGHSNGEFVLVTFKATRRTKNAQVTFHGRTDCWDFAGVRSRGEGL